MSWTVSDEEFSAYSSEALRARPLGSLAASLMGVAALAVLAGALLWVRVSPVDMASSSPPADAVATPASAEIFAPAQGGSGAAVQRSASFDLDVSELAKEKKAYSVQQRERGGGRQDTLSFGEFAGGKLYLRFDILQTAGEKLGNSDFFLDMARHAAKAGLAVTRIGQPSPLAARLGAFESADIRLSQTGDGGASAAAGERGCLAVRLLNSKLSVEIAGLACGVVARPIDRRAMSCLLDRLQYVPAGDDKAEDKALERLFAKADPAQGQGCLAAAAPAPAATGDAASAKKRAAAARRANH